MSSWRIREIENEIRELESKLNNCSERERYEIIRRIDDLKSELKRLKRREEEEEEEDDNNGILGLAIGLGSLGDFGSNGSHGFGGGGFGGGGSGGSW